jgi:hypothetical protein
VELSETQHGLIESGDMLQDILNDIHSLEEDLLRYERKYGVRSETFYAAYMRGEEPNDDARVLDFTEWASVYRTWLARQADWRSQSTSSGPRN